MKRRRPHLHASGERDTECEGWVGLQREKWTRQEQERPFARKGQRIWIHEIASSMDWHVAKPVRSAELFAGQQQATPPATSSSKKG